MKKCTEIKWMEVGSRETLMRFGFDTSEKLLDKLSNYKPFKKDSELRIM
jgi:hypothetical protein